MNDSITIANNYWDLGRFYSKNNVKDSAYYSYSKAEKIYESLGKKYYGGLMLLNMAIIQSDLRDYTGSEVTTFRAIELLKPLDKYKYLYSAYNNLGIVFNELEEYDKALFYHNKALEYQAKIEGENTFKSNTLNNVGVVYKNDNQHYKAIKSYNEALNTQSLKQQNTKLYAMLLDNLAYSKFKLNDTIGVNALFQESLHLRDSIGDISGKTINKLHLAEYHAAYNDSIKALQLANEAKDLAENSKNYRDLLASLLLLSKLDKKNSDQYSQRYIALNDKLLKEERAIRDKFARIRFETDEFIEENEALAEEKEILTEQKKRILTIGSILLVLGVLIYIIRDQRLKNIRLRLEKEQQQANEEIYNLMLTQQYKLDEGKRNEKKRMSEELHDGVLGNLYGIKMNLAVLNQQSNPDAILKREEFIEGLSNVIDEIRNVSHELHANALDADVGYMQLIEDLLIQKSEVNGYNYELLVEEDTNWQVIAGDIKMNIYRIIQEAIQNINKYAQANKVKVELKSDGDFIHLTISDDGIGFNTKTKKDGIGIKNIKSRVERLNGSVEFLSELKKGTSIIIKIPYIGI
ncbi:tetratricopeptide repeat protein [Aureibaculum sp. 2210JD6-5]|uniref:tetratricopeptide repeat-containing sensor histidine kinase n=1 Tax=Aureibaculum sp. 2210JD6-5 TaxID=3103957 RepID=UPI002AAC8A84|nr:tetratricopeptide repeat protein [Aureibaculum sp. 2210JD6-5]MDY7394349.1 tetratricopeptide repeat protein [Aureibaculum sp. 2210JD6-5]